MDMLSETSGSLDLALLRAIAADDKRTVCDLLACGADVNGNVQNGPTPLDMAVIADRPEMARLLVSSGADVNLRKGNGWTSLHVAGFEGRRKMMRVLIALGGDAAAVTGDGLTPSDIARRAGHGGRGTNTTPANPSAPS
jgi:ankyrin repeat protein